MKGNFFKLHYCLIKVSDHKAIQNAVKFPNHFILLIAGRFNFFSNEQRTRQSHSQTQQTAVILFE
jgi:hypothetical protein